MTTTANSTVIDNTSDAGFRAWGSEFASLLALVGMVQTADTGQINWVTVTRPGATGTAAGYEIWRYGDSAYYVKFEYGTGTGAITNPGIWCTWGTGSNGSGTITGQTNTRNLFTTSVNPASTVTAYTTRMCHVQGSAFVGSALAISWKEGSGNLSGTMGFMVHGRTTDGSGAWTSTGFALIRQLFQGTAGSATKQCVRSVAGGTAVAQTFNDVTTDFMVPGNPTTTTQASTGASQAYQIPVNVPDVGAFAWCVVVMQSELPRGTTMLVAMQGIFTRTYISVGTLGNQTFANGAAGVFCPAMIYQ